MHNSRFKKQKSNYESKPTLLGGPAGGSKKLGGDECGYGGEGIQTKIAFCCLQPKDIESKSKKATKSQLNC